MSARPYAKAIYAALSTLLASLLLVIDAGITAAEALQVLLAVVTVTGGVYGLRNDTPIATVVLDKPDL